MLKKYKYRLKTNDLVFERLGKKYYEIFALRDILHTNSNKGG
jgi:hypothetical protein